MNIEELREYCLSVKGSAESTPFLDHSVLVFKVMDKMFAYIGLNPKDGIFRLNLKCNPARSVELRERYAGVGQCTHSKSLLWNTVCIGSDVPDELIRELINHSVDEVLKSFSKKKKQEYLDS